MNNKNYQVSFTNEAKFDLLDARKYFKSIIPGLEKRFTVDLKKTIERISINPLIFGFRFKKFRTANLKIFPYQIHYQVNEENMTVIIFAVLHAFRDPDFIKNRIK